MKRKNKWTKAINKYTLTIIAFVIWITLLDSRYSFLKQAKLNKQISDLEHVKEDYRSKLQTAEAEYKDLLNNREKYAREKYYISKPGETVYIIEK